MGSKLLILTVLLAGLAYYLYEPVPDGYCLSSRLTLHAYAAVGKLGLSVGRAADTLGLFPSIALAKRATMPATSGVNFSEYNIKANEELFDGVKVRIYRPIDQKGSLPGFVYYHGGGWVLFNLNPYDVALAEMSRDTNTVVVSIDYRLAPDHVFPAAHEDCVKATKFFLKNAAKYKVDSTRVGIGGDSAGGNLAATVALQLRDDKFEPKVKLQVLIYPVLQGVDLSLPSYQNCDGMLLTKAMMAQFHAFYTSKITNVDKFGANQHVPNSVRDKLAKTHLNVKNLPKTYTKDYIRPQVKDVDEKLWTEIKSNMLNPYFSPLLAENLKGLPKTYLFSCGFDVLRDEGLLYAHRLKEDGVEIEQYMFENGFHGLFLYGRHLPEIYGKLQMIHNYIKTNL